METASYRGGFILSSGSAGLGVQKGNLRSPSRSFLPFKVADLRAQPAHWLPEIAGR